MGIDKRGRVVKEKRVPTRSAPRMGENGIALVEFIGHGDVLREFTIHCEDGDKTYLFCSRPAHKTQFVDKLHGDYLVEQYTDGAGTSLFRIIAQYATAANKRRLELRMPSELEPPDDLPSGFAPERDGIAEHK